MRAYDKGQYAEAIPNLENHLKSNPSDNHVRMYLGISHLLNGQPQNAVHVLSGPSSIDGDIGTTSRWYLALANLALNDEKTAKLLLEQLTTDVVFGQKAKNLIEDIH